jgi:hypothetical protein
MSPRANSREVPQTADEFRPVRSLDCAPDFLQNLHIRTPSALDRTQEVGSSSPPSSISRTRAVEPNLALRAGLERLAVRVRQPASGHRVGAGPDPHDNSPPGRRHPDSADVMPAGVARGGRTCARHAAKMTAARHAEQAATAWREANARVADLEARLRRRRPPAPPRARTLRSEWAPHGPVLVFAATATFAASVALVHTNASQTSRAANASACSIRHPISPKPPWLRTG